ncbi:MAG: hypothetical protein ACR2NO_08940 [Chloroflexota bacterium]
MSIDSPVNVATPELALLVTVPPSVPLPGLVPMASVTEAPEVVTVFPYWSRTATVMVPRDDPAAALVGCPVNAN